jgi:hypothetical protein
MIDSAGIWIDHRKAFVVTLSADAEHTQVILSKAQKHLERGGDSPLKGRYDAHSVPADDGRQRALTAELNGYYDTVIAAVRSCGHVFIFGPGEAKGELRKRLSKINVGELIAKVATADKMTNREIVAKVREYFGRGAMRAQPKLAAASR